MHLSERKKLKETEKKLFKPHLETVFVCNNSHQGLGAALVHPEHENRKTVSFESKLRIGETRYSVNE